jgi:cell wall-associated NlpC family hydrolase
MTKQLIVCLALVFGFAGAASSRPRPMNQAISYPVASSQDTPRAAKSPAIPIYTGDTTPGELVSFARSLLGTPYKYASTDPMQGFDCSGFVTYVFNHFGMSVPRSSSDFISGLREVGLKDAKPGDILLFTGTDSDVRSGGHVAIVVSNHGGQVVFIHSTSGKARGVTETPLNDYYMGRYLKTIRLFSQNDQ